MRCLHSASRAALYALDHHVERLADDHARARRLAEGLQGLTGVTVEPAHTNMVFLDVERERAAGIVAQLTQRGLLCTGLYRLRLVTHLDVDDDDIDRAIGILREYGVSQMPVVGAEPPVMAGEVAGSVSERELLSAVFEGRAKLADAVAQHMSPPLPLIGAGELASAAAKELREVDAVMVVDDGKPVGVLTRHDLLGFLSQGGARK